VIVSDAIPLRNIVEKKGVGLWYKSGDSHQLFDCIKALVNKKSYYYQISQKAPEIAIKEFNWENQEHLIFEALE